MSSTGSVIAVLSLPPEPHNECSKFFKHNYEWTHAFFRDEAQPFAGKVGRNYGRQKSVSGRGKGYGYQSLGVDFVEIPATSEIRNGGSVLVGAGDPTRTRSAIEPFQSLGSL